MYELIVFLPLIGSVIAGLAGTNLFKMMGSSVTAHGDVHSAAPAEEHHGHSPAWPAYLPSPLLVICAVLSWVSLWHFLSGGTPFKIDLFTWVNSGTLTANWALRIDTLTAVMLVVVNTVSSLVHIYSIGYMGHDPHQPRFFAYLSLFTFAMLMLVTADNLLQMFFGWEGVGLASYLLIGFWYHRPSANAAAIKAFIVNRLGDFGFALGIFGLFFVFKSINLDEVFREAAAQQGKTFLFAGYQVDIMTTLCLLLFMGACGKSAQFLLHTWLPDAMEGPT